MRIFSILVLSASLSFPIMGYAADNGKYDLTMHVIASTPLGYKDKKIGKTVGVHWEVIGELSKRSGLKINRVLMPYPRIWAQMKTGEHDGGLVWRSSDRNSYVNYVHMAFRDYITFLTLKNKEIKSYDELYGKEIGKMRGLSISDRFNNDDKLKVVEITKYDNSIKMLILNRLDGVIGNVHAYYKIAEDLSMLKKLSFPGYYMGHRDVWLQFSKKSPHQDKIATLRTTMKKMFQDGTLKRIRTKYYGNWINEVNEKFQDYVK